MQSFSTTYPTVTILIPSSEIPLRYRSPECFPLGLPNAVVQRQDRVDAMGDTHPRMGANSASITAEQGVNDIEAVSMLLHRSMSGI